MAQNAIMTHEKPQNGDSLPKSRLLLGGAIFILTQLAPIYIPLIAASGLTIGWKAFLSSLCVVGIPDLGILVSVALLGKPGFNYLRGRVFQSIRRYALPKTVSRNRYRLGLVLFWLPLLYGWLTPYLPLLFPGYEIPLYAAVAGDLLLLLSLFVLGGDFWNKLRALFLWEARVANPGTGVRLACRRQGQSSL